MLTRSHNNKLMDFQEIGVQFLTSRKNSLLADEVGLGKTAQALVSVQRLNAQTALVICPSAVKYNWRKEALKWGFCDEDIVVVGGKGLNEVKNRQSGLFIINYDIAFRKSYAKCLINKQYDVLILDECHYLKNRSAKRTKAVLGRGGYADRTHHVFALSGTPVLNRPEELYALLSKLYPEGLGQYANYLAFTRYFCEGHDGNWGWDATGASNIKELSDRLSGFMLRRNRDLLPNLPEKTMRKITLPADKHINEQLFKEREGDESVRRLLGIGKVHSSINHIKDVLESEEKIIVFAYHRDVLTELTAKLKTYDPILVMGGDSAKQKFDKVQLFQSDPRHRIFIGQIDAAGVGIDGLQEVANVCVFVEIAWTPGSITQAIGRVHRNGQRKKVVVDFIIIEGSVDEDVLDRNIFKAEIAQTLMKDKEETFKFSSNSELTKNKQEEIMSDKEKVERMKLTVSIEMNCTSGELENLLAPILKVGQQVETVPVSAPTVTNQEDDEPKKTRKRRTKKEIAAEKNSMAAPVAETPLPLVTRVQPESAFETTLVTPAAPEVKDELPYKDQVMEASRKIHTFVGARDPEQINSTMAEVSNRITRAFPGVLNVLSIDDPAQQKQALDIINTFMEEKGVV